MAGNLSAHLFPNGFSKAVLRRAVGFPLVMPVWQRFEFGSLDLRVEFGISPRPYQLYGIYRAAQLASRLDIPSISAIEFGVAGGAGLLAMEKIAEEVGRTTGVTINVFGFDLGSGLPAPQDYRDLPYVWERGYYQMDADGLRTRLKRAKLLLGDVRETIPSFLTTLIAPIGYISFDLDYYSSTVDAFRIFAAPSSSRLPRTYCYFDDILGSDLACHNEYTGELLAIREFNRDSEMKLSTIHGLAASRPLRAAWHQQMYVLHDFHHPLYNRHVANECEVIRHLPISG